MRDAEDNHRLDGPQVDIETYFQWGYDHSTVAEWSSQGWLPLKGTTKYLSGYCSN